MRNISDNGCRKNQKAQFKLNSFLKKIVPFMRKCGKIFKVAQATGESMKPAVYMLNG